MEKRKTAGELSIKASSDSTKYDAVEVGHALTEDIQQQLQICVERHNPIFDEDEYCVGYVIASDPLIKNVMRRKFFAFLYLPQPRPNQAIFLYNKKQHKITKRLWTLPNAATMAELSEIATPHPKYQLMKMWCDAFFTGWKYNKHDNSMINKNPSHFFDVIRKQHQINMLSEKEYLNANREKLVKSGCQQVSSFGTDSFDFSKVSINKIVDTKTALV